MSEIAQIILASGVAIAVIVIAIAKAIEIFERSIK